MTETEAQEEVVSQLKNSASMSGLLFSPHPDVGGWKTTRALSPEVVAFTNKDCNPEFDRLAIEYHEGGIPDENGYIPEEDEYRVVATDRAMEYGEMPAEAVYDTLESALGYAAGVMIEVVEDRE